MANLKGNGAPTRKTKGALGDIYTDTTTGKKYKCIFSYRDDMSDEYGAQWKGLGVVENQEVVNEEEKGVVENQEVVNEEEKSVVEKPEVKKEESKSEPKKTANQKTNYAAYSKKEK